MKFQVEINKNAEEIIKATIHNRSSLIDDIENLVMNYEGTDKITGYTEDSIKQLLFSDIECIFIENGKTYAVLSDGNKYIIKSRLYEIEKLLSASFIKINKSAIGNLEKIEKFSSTLVGAVDAIFKCGHIEYVSRRCFADIKRRLF